jgi:type II pantothenate kinase
VDFVAGAAAVDPALAAYVQSGQLVCLPSGQQSTLLDLSQSGSELNGWVQMELKSTPKEEWLVVLDGMGRSLESNWQAGQYFKEGIDVLSLAMIKSEINAQRLEAEVYDCVVRLHGAETAASAV